MEDSTKKKAQPEGATPKGDRVIDLTLGMEIGTGARGKIIELTKVLDSPSDRSALPASDVSGAPQAPPVGDAADNLNVEADVDAAFDAMQAPGSNLKTPPDRSDDGLSEPELELSTDDLPAGAKEPELLPQRVGSRSQQGFGNADATLDLTDIVFPDDTLEMSATVLPFDVAPPKTAPPSPHASAADDADDIIELTDIFDAADPAAGAGDEEEALELTDIVDALESVGEEEEIIELTDIVDLAELEAGAGEDEILELLDVVDLDGLNLPSPVERRADAGEDQVLRLDSVLSHVRKNKNKVAHEVSLGFKEELLKETASARRHADGQGADGLPSDRDIERAIEKILETKYGDLIESIIAKVVEKVVTREMENIKRNLLEGED